MIIPVPTGLASRNPNLIPLNFFGMHFGDASSWPITVGSARIWAGVDGPNWSNMEPSLGAFDFSQADQWIGTLRANGIAEIVMVVSYPTPSWAAAAPTDPPDDMQDWTDFCSEVVAHFGDSVIYEGPNEINDTNWYTGTYAQAVQMQQILHDAVKGSYPGALVLSPSTTGVNGNVGMGSFLQAGGGAYCDALAWHDYWNVTVPEGVLTSSAAYRATAIEYNVQDKPQWMTEGSFETSSNLPNDQARAAYVSARYVLAWARGIQRYIWYFYDAPNFGTIWDGSELTAAGVAYVQVQEWLTNAYLVSWTTVGTVYIVKIARGSGYSGQIVWDSSGTGSSYTPAAGTTQYRDLTGATTSYSSGAVTLPNNGASLLFETGTP